MRITTIFYVAQKKLCILVNKTWLLPNEIKRGYKAQGYKCEISSVVHLRRQCRRQFFGYADSYSTSYFLVNGTGRRKLLTRF